MKTATMYRQGDVLIEQISDFTKDKLTVLGPGKIVLAQGEATGHAHTLECEEFQAWQGADEILISLAAPGLVTHQEHAPIALSPGNYRVSRQREYSPEAIRHVTD